MTTSIDITFEGPDISAGRGVELDVVVKVVKAFRTAVESIVADVPAAGASRDSTARVTSPRLTAILPGSVVTRIDFGPEVDSQAPLLDVVEGALDRIMRWQSDGEEPLPPAAATALQSIGEHLTADIERVTIRRPGTKATLQCPRRARTERRTKPKEEVDATLYGWLREVNWAKGTAQLHDYVGDGFIRLVFAAPLAQIMRELATESVRVKGTGRLNRDDSWATVMVTDITAASGQHGPFDVQAFLNNPDAKLFGAGQPPPQIVLTDEEFDSFNRAIREGRKA